MANKIEFAFLRPYPNLEAALKDLAGISHNKIKKHLSKGERGRKISPRQTLLFPIDLLNHGQINPHCLQSSVEILHECHRFLVLNKPPDMHGHPLNYSDQNNCLSHLRAEGRGGLLVVNGQTQERGLLNRLDYGTSGILCYVKGEGDYRELRENFSSLVKKKLYYALVPGRFELPVEKASHYLRPMGPKGEKMVILEGPQADAFEAQALFRLRSYDADKNQSLVEVELLTGVRHQVRAQLAALGFSIVGDELYGGIKAQRLYLHAHLYELELHGRKYCFTSSLPW